MRFPPRPRPLSWSPSKSSLYYYDLLLFPSLSKTHLTEYNFLCLKSLPSMSIFSSSCHKLYFPAYEFFHVCHFYGVLETIKFFFGSNQIEPKLNLFRLCFGLFSETKQIFFSLFRFVSVLRSSIETTKTNWNKLEKISQKQISIRLSSKQLIFFSVRTKTNRNSTCFGCFSVCFFARPNKIFFGLFWCFRLVSKQPKQTELMVWRIKKVYILTNLLLFR